VIVVAETPADYASNVQLVPTFGAILRKVAGVKDVHMGLDADNLAITSSSVWPDAASMRSVTDTAEWKATAAKLKSKPLTVQIFQIVE